ncbi:hypothetical protein Ancab_022432 [Ancistrocladus abbreviatus]
MEKLVSSWFTGKKLPENYVFPIGKRPGNHPVRTCRTIPVINLERACDHDDDRTHVVQEIMKACQDYGFFQVINHRVEGKLRDDAMEVFKEIFELPVEGKSTLLIKDDPNQDHCKLYTSSAHNYDREPVHYWRDVLKHTCSPLAECIQYWPEKPTRYREVVGPYCAEVKELGSRILELICEGLGLEKDYLQKELSEGSFLAVNHYPPCPDPSLTLGLAAHCDPNLITILLQGDVPGLQVFKDGEWIGIDPLPGAFVVNIGYVLHAVSNGKLKSAVHRAVTNSYTARTTAAFFIYPTEDCLVKPAKALVTEDNRPVFKAFQYGKFYNSFVTYIGDINNVLESYKIKP